MLQGCRGYRAVGQWLAEQPLDFCHRLGFLRRPPTGSGLRKLLMRVDKAAFEQALTRWIEDVLGEPASADALRLTPLDGKALWGTWDRFGRAVQLLALLDAPTGCVLHQRQVPSETNEHTTALALLGDLVLTGRVVSGDAAFCHRDVCRTIVQSGGHYLLSVDENRPQLRWAIESEFAACEAAFSPYARREREAQRQTVSTVEKGHGRTERRTLTSTTGLTFFLRQQLGWSSVRQVFRVTSERVWTDRATGERRTSRQTACGLTDRGRDQADAARLLRLSRGHWGVENRVFYVRDEAYGEDRSRVRRRAGAQVFVAIRWRRDEPAPPDRQHEHLRQPTQLHLESSARHEPLAHLVTGHGPAGSVGTTRRLSGTAGTRRPRGGCPVRALRRPADIFIVRHFPRRRCSRGGVRG